jgi:hypothetical protein
MRIPLDTLDEVYVFVSHVSLGLLTLPNMNFRTVEEE